MDPNSRFWPDDVPPTLWQFSALAPEAQRDFPFVGLAVSWQFVIAFLAGSVIICAFAWRRFSEPSFDVNTDAFRDFRDLKIWNLKDSETLRRAYVIYCVSLIFIYAMLTFFGKVIFQLASQMNVSGLQVSFGTFDFTSGQWPFLLAVGIAGFAPLINPLVPAERMLRRFAHEAVGIPTRLREKANRIKPLIDGDPVDDAGLADRYQPWVNKVLGPKLGEYLELKKNLEAIVHWSSREHEEWSDPEIRRKLNEYEKKARDDAEDALLSFKNLVVERGAREGSTSASHRDEQKQLAETCLALERARDRFAIIMAIYIDYGSSFERMEESDLKEALSNGFPAGDDLPATGLPLYGVIVIFSIYYFFLTNGWHQPILNVPASTQNTAIIAAAETLKVFLLTWLPVTAVATFTVVIYGPRPRDGLTRSAIVWRDIASVLAATGISAASMALFAILKTALISDTTEQMSQSLLRSDGAGGVLLFYMFLAPVSGICIFFINLVRRYPEQPYSRRRLRLSVIAGLLTFGYLAYVASGLPISGCMRYIEGHKELYGLSLLNMWWQGHDNLQTCFTYYATLDLLVISASVFISVIGLTRRRRPQHGQRVSGHVNLVAAAGRTLRVSMPIVALLAGLVPGGTTPARAAGDPPSQPGSERTIVLGFRTDIPPFSFLPKTDGTPPPQPFRGYIAELCYEIFDGGPWKVKQLPIVDFENRFGRIRRQFELSYDAKTISAVKDDSVDVLCDATTLWVADKARMDAGIFSPIIFASGISYFYRPGTMYTDTPTQIGYLKSSTSARVAWEVCQADVLKAARPGRPARCWSGSPIECLADAPSRSSGNEPPETSSDPAETRSLAAVAGLSAPYVLCPRASHDELISWFCNESEYDKIYVGDREIIQAKEADWRARGNDCQDVRPAGKTFTYEPYALLVSKHDPELVAFVQRRVYELFSHRAGVRTLFAKWFPDQSMSPTLAWLFLLNGVSDEGDLLRGPKAIPSESGLASTRCAIAPVPAVSEAWDGACP